MAVLVLTALALLAILLFAAVAGLLIARVFEVASHEAGMRDAETPQDGVTS